MQLADCNKFYISNKQASMEIHARLLEILDVETINRPYGTFTRQDLIVSPEGADEDKIAMTLWNKSTDQYNLQLNEFYRFSFKPESKLNSSNKWFTILRITDITSRTSRTITSVFILPTLKIPPGQLTDLGFINAYYWDELCVNTFENCIYLLFRPEKTAKFCHFIEEEKKRTDLLTDYYDHENSFTVLVYRLPEGYSEDYNLIIQSRYSKTSKEFQNLFRDKITIVKNGIKEEVLSLQYQVFNRTDDLMQFWARTNNIVINDDTELWYCFDNSSETLTRQKLSQMIRS